MGFPRIMINKEEVYEAFDYFGVCKNTGSGKERWIANVK